MIDTFLFQSSRLLSWREDKSHFGHQLAVLKVKTNPSKASSRTVSILVDVLVTDVLY